MRAIRVRLSPRAYRRVYDAALAVGALATAALVFVAVLALSSSASAQDPTPRRVLTPYGFAILIVRPPPPNSPCMAPEVWRWDGSLWPWNE